MRRLPTLVRKCKHCLAGEEYRFACDSFGRAVASHGYNPDEDSDGEMIICERYNRFVDVDPSPEDAIEATFSTGYHGLDFS
jgi:hypothetical protein